MYDIDEITKLQQAIDRVRLRMATMRDRGQYGRAVYKGLQEWLLILDKQLRDAQERASNANGWENK